ncbi:MAG: DUF1573 domain-containing protein [Bacteroidia bacterium]
MRKAIFLYLPFLLSFSAAPAQPVLKFEDSKKNFGFVKQGKIIDMEFNFTNTGDQPLIIAETKVECSCTAVEKPEGPVLPGQAGTIKVKFTTASVYDRQDRIIEILSNDPKSPAKIRFKGVVLKK